MQHIQGGFLRSALYFFDPFSRHCFSAIWKGEKYKPYILKYKALILK